MEKMHCPALVKDTVCLEAQVKIVPEIKIGRVIVKCKGDPFIGRCPGTPQKSCSFSVSQRIHVEVPLSFRAEVFAEPNGIVCGEPKVDDREDCAMDEDFDESEAECGNCK